MPEYTLRQNVVISVYHKHKPCENHTNVVGIKRLVGGEHWGVRDKRGQKSGKYGTGDGIDGICERARSVKNVTVLHSILQ